MRIFDTAMHQFHELPYLTARPRGGIGRTTLPFLRGTVEMPSANLDGLILASDLQGREMLPDGQPGRLLGEAVAEELHLLSELGELPPLSRLGVILAGDLYVVPRLDRRGGHGDVRAVWQAFRAHAPWVVGVEGNHDSLGMTDRDIAAFEKASGCIVLDGNLELVDDLRIAGVGGIIGKAARPGRRDQTEYIKTLRKLVSFRPDILVLHPCPEIVEEELIGSAEVRAVIDQAQSLVVCGHAHWPRALVEIPSGPQVLNVDSRLILLESMSRLT